VQRTSIHHCLSDLLELFRDDTATNQERHTIKQHLDRKPVCDAPGEPKQAERSYAQPRYVRRVAAVVVDRQGGENEVL
jgi:hypothetical protein